MSFWVAIISFPFLGGRSLFVLFAMDVMHLARLKLSLSRWPYQFKASSFPISYPSY